MEAKQSARERILRAAHDLFYRDGVRATGVDRLIAEAGVTKVTFYRHFACKDDLVRAFLAYRHERWMDWFVAALARHIAAQDPGARRDAPLAPLHRALEEWFCDPAFRGCAFINSIAELGGALPGICEAATRHKREMTEAIVALMPDDPHAPEIAEAAALAVDGAIVRAQAERREAQQALTALRHVLDALISASRTA
ncbi:MAG TPA: helix-turn-helix domain-containing protein [Methylocystis sp.]|nr:helix-turn-helix domain-containing protein [Methylocystis sp.]